MSYVVIGAVEGQFYSIFDKLSKLQTKNAFSFAIAIGDLFADPALATPEHEDALTSLLNGTTTIPLPIYFMVGTYVLPPRVIERLESANGEIRPNLYFLGKRSTTKTSEGIRIVSLGGSLDTAITVGLSKESHLPFHTEGDAKSLHGANSADILLTTNWPTSIRNGSRIPLPESAAEPVSEDCIANLCATLRPRYHFSSTPTFFYEREPFTHPPPDSDPTNPPSLTRFISLASPDASTKAKYIYAFTLDPKMPPTVPPNSTPSPFPSTKKRLHPSSTDHSYSRFSTHHHRAPKRPKPGPTECFFCLSSPDLATHLITSIANESYLTTAKGPLSTPETFSPLKHPAHILIIPFAHSPTLSSIPETASREATYAEMTRYRHALQSMLEAQTGGDLGAVTWEVSRREGVHVHWQFLPIKRELVEKGVVAAAFKVEAENERYPLLEAREIGDGGQERGDYFRVWIWAPKKKKPDTEGEEDGGGAENGDKNGTEAKTEGREKSLVLPLDPSFRFDLQFGRRVMAKLLGLEKRFNWRDCGQEEAEEVADVEAFKKGFKRWDFSLEE